MLTIRVMVPANPLGSVRRWFIFLNYDLSKIKLDADRLSSYEMAILDPDVHPPFELFSKKTILMAYVSLGEAEDYRSYWTNLKDYSWILGENENWKGNFYADVRDPAWHAIILRDVLPKIVREGFRGIFMDTLDTAEYLESKDPEKFAGSRRAMSDLVLEIRAVFPELLLISNNGFAILPEIAPILNGMLVEDITMMPDFEKGGYRKVLPEERDPKVAVLRPLAKKYHLPVFSIDYAREGDRFTREICQEESRKLGFRPYVAEKDLSELYEQAI